MNNAEHHPLIHDMESEEITSGVNTEHSNEQGTSVELKRNLIGFWFLGLCNHLGPFFMLSAAFDILSMQQGKNKTTIHTNEKFHCNPASTGMVLLAGILPTLFIKLTAPFYMQHINYHIRVSLIVLLLMSSLLTVAISPSVPVSLFGIMLGSMSHGAGEITFLSISTHFKKATVLAWSSGTGMAGVAGALTYAGLIEIGLTSRDTILVLFIVPAVFSFTFWFIIKMPNDIKLINRTNSKKTAAISSCLSTSKDKTKYMSLKMKSKLIISLLKYMVPLFFVYLAEYTINQGLYELLFYQNATKWLSQASQYRWFQVDYQIGVFISRSSGSIFRIKKLWIPVSIQFAIFILLIIEVRYPFIPYIWITLGIIFLEGLCGGAVYVNAFYLISEEVSSDVREFSMGAASMADSLGVSIAGGIAITIHESLCKVKLN